MRRIRYGVAMSLDGYIAGPNGAADWIVSDPEFDFAQLWNQFDTLLMGRRTYRAAVARLGEAAFRGKERIVVSRTLRASEHPGVTVIAEVTPHCVDALRTGEGKDIWLMGGGELFRSLLQIGAVDTVEASVIPVLLGSGVSLLPATKLRTQLRLAAHRVYGSGMVQLSYDVTR